MDRSRRPQVDWAARSTRRLLTFALLYGVGMGCLLGATQALIGHKSLGDAVELIAFTVVVWCVIALAGVCTIRWLARHPRT